MDLDVHMDLILPAVTVVTTILALTSTIWSPSAWNRNRDPRYLNHQTFSIGLPSHTTWHFFTCASTCCLARASLSAVVPCSRLIACVRVMWTFSALIDLYPLSQVQQRQISSGSGTNSSLGLVLVFDQNVFIDSSHPCLVSDRSGSQLSFPGCPRHSTRNHRSIGVSKTTFICFTVNTSSVRPCCLSHETLWILKLRAVLQRRPQNSHSCIFRFRP